MKTDRELLDLAFNAAGLKSTCIWYGEQEISYLESVGLLIEHDAPVEKGSPHPHPYGRWWNPLTDDGDALRLAVKLKLDIYHYPRSSEPYVSVHDEDNRFGGSSEDYGTDPMAATRRAIVRAAAEIAQASAPAGAKEGL